MVGDTTRSCQANGEWTGTEPVCEAVTCGLPPSIPSGQVQFKSGQELQYVCSPGFTLRRDSTTTSSDRVRCLGNGSWSKEPQCVAVTCNIPNIPHARRVEGGYGPYGYKAVVRYECNEGFKMVSGTSQMVCLENGWSSMPKCEAVSCFTPNITNARRVEGGSGPYYGYKTTVRYECNEGFKMVSGSSKMVCLENGWSSTLKCEADCTTPLGLESRRIPDEKMTASSVLSKSLLGRTWEPHYARLDNWGRINAWSPATNDRLQWLQVDLDKSKRVTGIITQGAKDYGTVQYVSAFKIAYSNYGSSWTVLKDPTTNLDKIFQGNSDNDGYQTNFFEPPFYARYVRFLPWEWHERITLRMELLGCDNNGGCTTPLGLESERIPDGKMTASSTLSKGILGRTWEPHYARLDHWGRINAWSPATNDRLQWLQVDLDKPKRFTGIITQGAKDYGVVQYVSAFKIAYSNDGSSWTVLKDTTTNSDKVFQGNTDNDTHKQNLFSPPFYARYVRFLPWEWHDRITLRMELLGCDQ
ncbi:lactadherin-like isoform X2 [Engraulis encrasicolus]|uniref:lactadherin-like isoform X2 n=1 Tax=Engraulis encrasicolus TaxID=184585 RepID=UPI002FD1C9D6